MKNVVMRFRQTLRVSMRALSRNKMRTFLTALGIIIGVGAVIAMVSIGEGAKRGIQERFDAMGTNLLVVNPGSLNFHGVHGGGGSRITLKEADAQAIAQNCDAVQAVSASCNTRGQVVYGNKNWSTQVQGTGSAFPDIRRWTMESGSFFDDSMVQSAAKVAVLGAEVKKNLFENEDPVGKIVRVKKIPFTVIGVLKAKGQSGGWFNQDDLIVVPYTTAMRRLAGIKWLNSIDVSAVTAEKTAEAQSQIENLLRDRHKIQAGADDDFNVRNMADIAESAAEATQMMTVLLGSIASISLLVGGIGIMNIMLVSVTERIREIGIRMAVGARERDILLQFLTEAIVLSLLGGLIGVGFGYGASKFLHNLKMFQGITTVVSWGSIALAFLFAASVGIFFGFYPARKASKLDPIEALRYE